ncbi:uncharacterized protein F4822DRAFT_446035 [Hypoxylon trugodes]|uniref:uncharacterized protein n=1 Tax=Hypoxylon trugodes TaxID=326681 RepID=UPI0021985903|nr:uncharacterized protein F4822DRAFT_446035 [Hypoxylon trugodes]KAI1384858.1 hypothetical protein F4822DRAFT_446035 [Hypoxylon trugodes]
MSAISSRLTRAGRQLGSRIANTTSAPQICHRRSTSWIAWEQPNPALYGPPIQALPSNETQQNASTAQNTRNVGGSVTAPATTAVAGGSQEVSTSGKTVPSSIQAGSSRIPFNQTRSIKTKSDQLPTTLIRVPGVTSTWPGEKPTHPDQQRVRKQVVVHEHGGPSREENPEPELEDILTRIDAENAPQINFEEMLGPYGMRRSDGGSYPDYAFEEVTRQYIDILRNLEEVKKTMAEYSRKAERMVNVEGQK